MPTVIMRKYDNPDEGYPSEIFEVVAVAPDGFDVQRHIDQLNQQQALLEACVKKFDEIITEIRNSLPRPALDQPIEIRKKWKASLKEKDITPEMRQEREEVDKRNESIRAENNRKLSEWNDQYIAKCVESASSIKNLPDDVIAEFQKIHQIPFEYNQNYVYFSREVPYVA